MVGVCKGSKILYIMKKLYLMLRVFWYGFLNMRIKLISQTLKITVEYYKDNPFKIDVHIGNISHQINNIRWVYQSDKLWNACKIG